MNSYGDLMTVEVACTWAQRESYVPSARLVVHSCPPVSTSLEPEFGPALEDEGAAWCKRRVYQRDFEVLRPQLSSMHRTLTSCWRVTLGVFDWRPPPRRKARQYSETKQQTCMSTGVPVRFVWTGYADEVAVGGSFNNWTRLFQLKASQGKGFEIVLWLPPGTHEYRYLVDGRWRVDASRLVVSVREIDVNRVIVQANSRGQQLVKGVKHSTPHRSGSLISTTGGRYASFPCRNE
ncbi:hypothetical protein NDN08_003935 [Rhodosorus marinus]|uniref:AMP-activated protein kinase glycogen-binding domain-containing protein n=1 Tax=Rhodosorus marinus TaxID=101924 RepID=A0AAV8UGW4_9RHOD|nr:hypothetical protein NDN08_003935 [Rhodosorus marinus]